MLFHRAYTCRYTLNSTGVASMNIYTSAATNSVGGSVRWQMLKRGRQRDKHWNCNKHVQVGVCMPCVGPRPAHRRKVKQRSLPVPSTSQQRTKTRVCTYKSLQLLLRGGFNEPAGAHHIPGTHLDCRVCRSHG